MFNMKKSVIISILILIFIVLIIVIFVLLKNHQIQCYLMGGSWSEQFSVCFIPTSDGGKFCSDFYDCEGQCIAELTKDEEEKMKDPIKIINGTVKREILYKNGTCSETRMVVGCRAFVTNGTVEGITCVL